MTTQASPQRAAPSFPPSPGSAASSISSKTLRPTSPASNCARRSPQTSADIRSVFNCTDRPSAERRLKEIVNAYSASAPKLPAWLETAIPQGLTVFTFPAPHQRRLRTSNPLERVNQEIKRRTRVASIFPNEASLLRLVSALLAETSDDWESSKTYLNMHQSIPPSV